MSASPERSERPLCLLDGYQGPVWENRDGNGMAEGTKRKLEILDRYPGRWALIGTEHTKNGVKIATGSERRVFNKYGCETVTVNNGVYARRPHPSGKPIEAIVPKKAPIEPLPALRPSHFGWSRDEINDALATAKSWLFPIEGEPAA